MLAGLVFFSSVVHVISARGCQRRSASRAIATTRSYIIRRMKPFAAADKTLLSTSIGVSGRRRRMAIVLDQHPNRAPGDKSRNQQSQQGKQQKPGRPALFFLSSRRRQLTAS